jgi:hypothetical protein
MPRSIIARRAIANRFWRSSFDVRFNVDLYLGAAPGAVFKKCLSTR